MGCRSDFQEAISSHSSLSARLSPLETLLEEDSGDECFFEGPQRPLHSADRHSSYHATPSNGRLSSPGPVHAGAMGIFEGGRVRSPCTWKNEITLHIDDVVMRVNVAE